MLPSTWQGSLDRLLNQLRNEKGKSFRIAVVGVGNILRSDDAAGVLVARALSARNCLRPDRLLVCEAGSAPENLTGELRKFAPDLVLFVDAAALGEDPGAIQWIAQESIDGMSASTHSLPLHLLVLYLTLELRCKVVLLGIQPASNELGETPSTPVLQAVADVAESLERVLSLHLSLDTLDRTGLGLIK
ncbi:MAG TPA: hydrogenase maturation protease [Anaerolineales bacterium]|nr:hydrogenase maturation protease [Anaerolineales bacterium]